MRAATSVLSTILCLLGGAAVAGNRTAAEAALLEGRDLMSAGKYDEACDAFEMSDALDSQFATRYDLALCYAQAGRIASAWELFHELAQRDPDVRRKTDSQRNADSLQPHLTRMAISIQAKPVGLRVTRNGMDVTGSVGVEAPVDPGTYRIEVDATGYRPWSTTVVATEEKTIQIDVPALAPIPMMTPPIPGFDVKSSARLAPGEKQPRAVIDRPRTLPAREVELDTFIGVATISRATNPGFTTEAEVTPTMTAGVGITHVLDLRVQYAPVGDSTVGASVGVTFFRVSRCAAAVRAGAGYDLQHRVGEPFVGGVDALCKLTRKLALFMPAEQVAIYVAGSMPPAYLDVPIGVGIQSHPQLFVAASTRLASIGLTGSSSSSVIFSDVTPLDLEGFLSISSKLDVGAGVGFGDLANPVDTFAVRAGIRVFL